MRNRLGAGVHGVSLKAALVPAAGRSAVPGPAPTARPAAQTGAQGRGAAQGDASATRVAVSGGPQRQPRLAFVDVLRGMAVALMMIFHTADGWIHPDLRAGAIWAFFRFCGGMAAPLFLTVAGVSLALRLASRPDSGSRARADALRSSVARALQLVVLGYGLRLQMWMLDGGGSQLLGAWLAALPLLGAYVLAYFGLGRLGGHRPASAAWFLALAALLFSAGIYSR